MSRWIVVLSGMLLWGCVEVTIPPEAGSGTGSTSGPGVGTATGTVGGTGMDPHSDTGLQRVEPPADSQQEPPPDLPESCDTHCDCPATYDCINQRCVTGDLAIYCCGAAACPAGSNCWFADGNPGTCEEP